MSRHFLSQLGLHRDADERAVKRAYAARLKTRRPDDDPVLFQQLHEAYRGALEYVRRRAAAETSFSTTMAVSTVAPTGFAPLDVTSMQPAAAGETEAPFNAGAFFEALLQAGLSPPAQFQAWLLAHPDMYSIQLRNRLVPALIDALETAHKLPTPEGLRLLLAFFGLDLVDRRTLHLQPRLERLHDIAHRQHQVFVGPDMSFMYPPDGVAPPPRPASGPNLLPIIAIILVLAFLGNIARCAVDPDHPYRAMGRDQAPVQAPATRPDSDPDAKPWRYAPPVPTPPPPAKPDTD